MSGTVQVVDPRTGVQSEMPAEEAQAAWMEGRRQIAAGSTISLINPADGTVADFDASKVQGAVDAGWSFANKSHVLRADAESAQGQAFVEGAGSALTNGFTDLLAREAGMGEGLAERRETTGGNWGTGIGLGLGLFTGSGEVGLAEQAAKGVAGSAIEHGLMGMASATAAGNAIEKTAAKALGRLVENEAVGNIAGAAVGRAVEGATFGIGGALSEESLGNPDMNAESLLAAMGGGALMGGALGGTLGAGFKALGEAGGALAARKGGKIGLDETQAADALAAMGVDVAADNGILSKFLKYVREDLPSSVGGYSKEDIQKVYSAKAQSWLREGKDVLEESGRDMTGVMDAVAKEQIQSAEKTYGSLRGQKLGELLPKGNPGTSMHAVADIVDSVKAKIQDFVDNAVGNGLTETEAASMARRYLGTVDDLEERIFKKAGVARKVKTRTEHFEPEPTPLTGTVTETPGRALGAGEGSTALTPPGWTPPRRTNAADEVIDVPYSRARVEEVENTRSLRDLADKFNLNDDVTRTAYDRLNHLKGVLATPGKFGDEVSGTAKRAMQDAFQDAYQTVRGGLENETVWGKAGTLQRDLNAAYAQRSQAWEELQKVMKFNGDRVDPAAVSSYIGKLDKLKGDRVTELLDRWQAANAKFADTAHTHFGAESGILERANKLQGEFSRVRTTLGEKAAVFNALNRLTQRRNAVFSFGGGGVIGSAITGGLGAAFGLPGVAAGLATQAIIDPGRSALMRANTAGALRRVNDFIRSKSEGIFDRARQAAPSPLGATRAISATVTRMLTAKTPDERQAAYAEHLDELRGAQDPYTFGQNVAQHLGDFQAELPAHADALARASADKVGMMAAALPKAMSSSIGDSVFDEMDRTPHVKDSEILKYAQRARILQDPLSIYDRIESGYIFRHEVEALDGAYPGLAAQIRKSVTEAAGGKKGPLGRAQGRALEQLMGGDPAGFQKVAQYQAVHAHAATAGQAAGGGAPAPSGGKPPKSARSSNLRSTSDRLENYPYGAQ